MVVRCGCDKIVFTFRINSAMDEMAEKSCGSKTNQTGIFRVPLPLNPHLRSPQPCAICMEPPTNLSFTNTCFHQFCRYCILEWSKVKWTCPVCKQKFTSVIGNVKSVTDYHEIEPNPVENITNEGTNSSRTSMTPARRALQLRIRRLSAMLQAANPILVFRIRLICERLTYNNVSTENLQADVRRLIGSTNYRRFLYDRNIRVMPANESRYRDCTPKFLKEYPAVCHRLGPWLKRELLCLLGDDDEKVNYVLDLIIARIKEVNINSEEFREALSPHLIQFTDQFIHEFYEFARSPYDLDDYDIRACYDQISSNEENVGAEGGDPDLMVISANVPHHDQHYSESTRGDQDSLRARLQDINQDFTNINARYEQMVALNHHLLPPLATLTESNWEAEDYREPIVERSRRISSVIRTNLPSHRSQRLSRTTSVAHNLHMANASFSKRTYSCSNLAGEERESTSVTSLTYNVPSTSIQSKKALGTGLPVATIHLDSDSEIDEPFYGFSRLTSSHESAESTEKVNETLVEDQPSTSRGVRISDPLARYRLNKKAIGKAIKERREKIDRIYSDIESDDDLESDKQQSKTIEVGKSSMDASDVEVVATVISFNRVSEEAQKKRRNAQYQSYLKRFRLDWMKLGASTSVRDSGADEAPGDDDQNFSGENSRVIEGKKSNVDSSDVEVLKTVVPSHKLVPSQVCAEKPMEEEPSTSENTRVREGIKRFRLDVMKLWKEQTERFHETGDDSAESKKTKKERITEDGEIEILAELKPRHLRTPELVDIDSDEEKMDRLVDDSKDNHDHAERFNGSHRREEKYMQTCLTGAEYSRANGYHTDLLDVSQDDQPVDANQESLKRRRRHKKKSRHSSDCHEEKIEDKEKKKKRSKRHHSRDTTEVRRGKRNRHNSHSGSDASEEELGSPQKREISASISGSPPQLRSVVVVVANNKQKRRSRSEDVVQHSSRCGSSSAKSWK